MPDVADKVRGLSDAAWQLRAEAPPWRGELPPFALALMTDDRRQPDLLALLSQLPSGCSLPPLAVIFRHDRMERRTRLDLAQNAMKLVQRKGHVFIYKGEEDLPGIDGRHGKDKGPLVTWAVHNQAEGGQAEGAHAALAFISPVFATSSHPEARPLGLEKAGALAQNMSVPAFALGGITMGKIRELKGQPFYGVGVIGAWSG